MLRLPWNFTLSSLFSSFLHCGQHSGRRWPARKGEMTSIPSASRAARSIDTVQQVVSEQTVLVPYARRHSHHTGLHRKRWCSQIWGPSQKWNSWSTMFLIFLLECAKQVFWLRGLPGHLVSMNPFLREKLGLVKPI